MYVTLSGPPRPWWHFVWLRNLWRRFRNRPPVGYGVVTEIDRDSNTITVDWQA